MMPRIERLLVLALLALSLGCGSPARAASPASALGPEAEAAQPTGGYVGRMNVAPDHGPAGTPLTITAEGLPAEQEARSGLADGEGELAGPRGRVSRPRIHAGRLPGRGGENRSRRPCQGDVRRAGGLRLRPRYRPAAGQTGLHPGRLQSRHDREDLARERPGGHADHRRGQRHRLAPPAEQLRAALRQQLHRLDVDGHHPWQRDLHHSRHRQARPARARVAARRLHLRLSQHAAIARARPATLRIAVPGHARGRRCCRRRPSSRRRRACAACRRPATSP